MTDFSLAFLGMFESLRMGPTFARGRRDERAGHVRSLTVSGSLVVALVRGPDDPVAFRARIAVRAFGASDWARVETELVSQARFTADLLNGRMPAGIEAIFAGLGLSLLPLSFDEVALDCSCERWPMPCVHLAATCYALARAFETDPFEVFTWRGRSRDELLMRLRRLREATAVDDSFGVPDGGSPKRGRPAGGARAGSFSRADGSETSHSGSFGDSGSSGDSGPSGAGRASGRPAAEDPVSFWGFGLADAGWTSAGGPEPDSADGRWAGAGSGAETGSAAGAVPGAGSASGAGSAAGTVPGAGSASGAGSMAGTGSGAGSAAGTAGGGVTRPDALLDQLDDPGLTHEGRPVVDVLRAAYLALPDSLPG